MKKLYQVFYSYFEKFSIAENPTSTLLTNVWKDKRLWNHTLPDLGELD